MDTNRKKKKKKKKKERNQGRKSWLMDMEKIRYWNKRKNENEKMDIFY